MKTIFICLSFSFCLSAFSQAGYNILYINQYRDKNGAYIPKTFSYTRMVFNDSYYYSYGFEEGSKDPMIGTEYPGKLLNHGVMSDRKGVFNYFKMYGLSKKYWYKDSIRTKIPKWIFSDDQKDILGYTCHKAYWLNEYFLPTKDSIKTWITDSVVVWYTKQILPVTNIFYSYSGIPGTVLEIHDQTRMGWYSRAIAITRQPIYIKFPEADMIKLLKRDKHQKW